MYAMLQSLNWITDSPAVAHCWWSAKTESHRFESDTGSNECWTLTIDEFEDRSRAHVIHRIPPTMCLMDLKPQSSTHSLSTGNTWRTKAFNPQHVHDNTFMMMNAHEYLCSCTTCYYTRPNHTQPRPTPCGAIIRNRNVMMKHMTEKHNVFHRIVADDIGIIWPEWMIDELLVGSPSSNEWALIHYSKLLANMSSPLVNHWLTINQPLTHHVLILILICSLLVNHHLVPLSPGAARGGKAFLWSVHVQVAGGGACALKGGLFSAWRNQKCWLSITITDINSK